MKLAGVDLYVEQFLYWCCLSSIKFVKHIYVYCKSHIHCKWFTFYQLCLNWIDRLIKFCLLVWLAIERIILILQPGLWNFTFILLVWLEYGLRAKLGSVQTAIRCIILDFFFTIALKIDVVSFLHGFDLGLIQNGI